MYPTDLDLCCVRHQSGNYMQSAYGTRSIFLWFGGAGLPCAVLLLAAVRDPSIDQRRRRIQLKEAQEAAAAQQSESDVRYGSFSAPGIKEEEQYALFLSAD
jgi:hypothetical protein